DRATCLCLENVSDIQQHLVLAAGLLADPNQVDRERGKSLRLINRLRQSLSAFDVLDHRVHSVDEYPVADGLTRYRQGLQERDAISQQSSQSPGEMHDLDLSDELAEKGNSQAQPVPLMASGGIPEMPARRNQDDRDRQQTEPPKII